MAEQTQMASLQDLMQRSLANADDFAKRLATPEIQQAEAEYADAVRGYFERSSAFLKTDRVAQHVFPDHGHVLLPTKIKVREVDEELRGKYQRNSDSIFFEAVKRDDNVLFFIVADYDTVAPTNALYPNLSSELTAYDYAKYYTGKELTDITGSTYMNTQYISRRPLTSEDLISYPDLLEAFVVGMDQLITTAQGKLEANLTSRRKIVEQLGRHNW